MLMDLPFTIIIIDNINIRAVSQEGDAPYGIVSQSDKAWLVDYIISYKAPWPLFLQFNLS